MTKRTHETEKPEVSKRPKRLEQWMIGLTEDEIYEYKQEIKKIKDNINESIISEKHIVKLKIPFEEKVKLMEEYNILKTLEKHTSSWYDQKNKLYESIDAWDMPTDSIEIINKLNKNKQYTISLREKILNSDIKTEIKEILYDKFKNIQTYRQSSEEYIKEKRWIETVLNIPRNTTKMFSNIKTNNKKLEFVYETLNNTIYGQTETKERIIEFVSTMITNPNSKSKILGLIGPPGVGKTALARGLSKALQLPFTQISLGGMSDSSILLGHAPTYLGATCGIITKSLIKMETLNGVLFLDEFDKISNGKNSADISNTLLHVLDYEQNNEFNDHYLPEIPIDLSKLFIILSFNSKDEIDPILLDRVNIVEVKKYSNKDKTHILKNYFVPKILKNLNMKPDNITFTDSAIDFIIEKNKNKEGVRQLEMDTYGILQRINTLCLLDTGTNVKLSYNIKNFKLPFVITLSYVKNLYKTTF